VPFPFFMQNNSRGWSFLKAVFVCCTFVAIPVAIPLQAQTAGGSVYSLFGLGDIQESSGAAFDGIGGAALGVTLPYAVNTANPAAWNAVRSTRFQTGFMFRQFVVSDGTTTSAQNGGYLQGFSAVFSIDTTRGISAGFGIVPRSNVQYAYRLNQDFGGGISTSTLFRGSGGMVGLYLGGAYQIVPLLNVGIMGEYDFGNIESEVQTDENQALNLNAGRTVNTDILGGFGGKLGLQFTGIPNLTVGAVVRFGLPMSITQTRLYKFSTSAGDSTDTTRFSTPMPLELGIGFGYRLGRVSLYADAVTKDFSNFSYRTRRDGVGFRRSTRVSVGLGYTGNADYGATFWESLGFSIGAGYHQQYYVVNGIGINEVYGSLGVQLPVARRVYFDVAAQAGSRGTIANGLVQELFVRLSFSVNIGEIWFQPLYRE
jgi:hypothetical protein